MCIRDRYSIPANVQGMDHEVANKLFANFMLMAVCFSVNHGTVTALLSLATYNLEPELGNLQNALLYGMYTITALCFAKIIVAKTGYKYGIVGGLSVYVFYVASFIIADKVPSAQWPAATIGGCLGGIAAGFLWTAQGAYFGRNAALYAEATGISKQDALLKFAGWFALPYLGFEVLMKLLQSYIGLDTGPASAHWSGGKDFIYVINTILAVLAVFGCLFIMPMEDEKTDEEENAPKEQLPMSQVMVKQAISASILFVTDPKMPLMMGMNVSFGIAAAYMNSYVTGIVLTFYLGGGYGGYLAAITAATAALLSFPLTNMSLITQKGCGRTLDQNTQTQFKKGAMVLGPISFALVCFLPIAVGYENLGTWGGLVMLYVLQGVGRGVWEATNKAIFAEYFAYDQVGAFSNLIIQNGGASTICFFINAYGHAAPSKSECVADGDCPVYSSLAWAGVISSILAVVGFLMATQLFNREIVTWAELRGGKQRISDNHQPALLGASEEEEQATKSQQQY
eukprot:TRINITY_DN5296_c0_g1_i3.p1 TRINITY_DN5296_c0_g1~~TRINITY_DN5296_c0_g1_i3.p1  ORF type:complete len:512 (-),score=149.29 TRINITY_DN5296_c0_g1_i3:66-1601(-)